MSYQQNDVSSTIDRMIHASTSAAASSSSAVASHQDPFIPSKTWNGPKMGYYFGTSDETKGTGYYLDTNGYGNGNGVATAGKKRSRMEQGGGTNGHNGDTDDDDIHQRSKKRQVRFGQDEIQTYDKDEDVNIDNHTSASMKLTGEQLLEQAEEQSKSNSQKTLDTSRGPSSIKSTILLLEKAISKNQLLRVKHSSNPSKFMNSELALYEEIGVWNDLAASIEYYTLFVNMGAVDSLKSLLMHDNVDIILCVVRLFNELLDPDLLNNVDGDLSVTAIGEQVCALMMAFLGWDDDTIHESTSSSLTQNSESNGLDMIIANLARLNEEEEEELTGIDDILTLVENLLDLDQLGVLKLASTDNTEKENNDTTRKTIVSHITKNSTLTSYLLMKLSDKKLADWTTTMKLHASEVLASIIQHEDARKTLPDISKLKPYNSMFQDDDDEDDKEGKKRNSKKKKETTLDGMECLLQAIAMYRKKEPSTDEECECLENISNALAASLLNEENVTVFLELQGIELMLRCINERVHSGFCSMKILFFCLSGGEDASSTSYQHAAETFIDAGGLKALFPIFMGRKPLMPRPAKCCDAGNFALLRKYAVLQKENSRKDRNEQQKKPSKRMKQVLAANREWFQTLEGYSIQILYSLTRYLKDSSPHDAKSRLASKFIENDCEKCDRLTELCLKYDVKMRKAEYDYFKSDEAEEAEENGIDVDVVALNVKLKAGGDLFHRLAAVIGFAAIQSKRSHEHILEQLRIQNSGIATIKSAISEFASMINSGGEQQKKLLNYLSAI